VSYAQKKRLQCDGVRWQPAPDCAGDENCNSEDGSCLAVLERCSGKAAGFLFCGADDQLLSCGEDLVTATVAESCSGECVETSEGPACSDPTCGDGKVQAGEACDDGNEDEEDECTSLCKSPSCGDGLLLSDEQCDDGNTTVGDGCEPDCTYSCADDADCTDYDSCNGEEVCDEALHSCVTGEAMDCSDSSACTDDTCDAIAGCLHTLVDGDGDGHAPDRLGSCGNDCDDGEPNTYAGAAELCDGLDNNCNGERDELAPTWYKDCDGDGFAAADATSIQQCDDPGTAPDCPQGSAAIWTSVAPTEGAVDCYDANAQVYPRTEEQNSSAFSSDAISGRSLAVDFDYNCDGTEERSLTWLEDDLPCVATQVPNLGWTCTGLPTWTTVVPPCGSSDWAVTCSGIVSSPFACDRADQVPYTLVQKCR
jgi:cysteine-rich repeat protein